ncbi:ABC-type dipeptide/oligopeptide/nickel transport system, permease component [Candidatus Nitrososphaera evergladensis SR1]|uniref:ABC-type dipeptide/oligopeptide/nickel transport system, permease component n=1 Tax=Candidatus Nitrososphaera evergladensis SR1 TaxID=1459636 RepID=A0A075MNX7_9ARCH|nr:ABC transporter permease [Candidatus Nitrososphaera evergladensis]AIF82850.1 ABC-type dipeptide/oligopeptide/nickel transport system, permease component [Candidatus Nitrososphaera evergladensis SR1]
MVGGFGRFLIRRSANMLIVLFATLVLTIALLGPTMDKILTDATRFSIVDEVNHGNLKFQSAQERQKYIDDRVQLQIKTLGLDEPWYSPKRFTNTVLKVMTLDLGRSNFFTSDSGSSSVRDIILEKMPKTVLLFTTSTLVITVIGLYLGAYVANKSGSVLDRLNSAFAVFSGSFPTWWVGILMIFAFAFTYHIFPARATPLTSPSDPAYVPDLLYHMVLPLITIVAVGFGSWAYIVRYFVVGILGEDYIAAKRAAGVPEKRIIYSHALKNAAPPIVTVIALSLAGSFGGAITVEAVFDWPGMGKLYYDAIGFLDIPVIIGLTYVATVIFVITVFVTDIVYAYFDPRVKVG